jgi:hypothetical protein
MREVNWDKVLKDIKSAYDFAVSQEGYIKQPLSWALYKTWQKYDRRKQ